MQLPTIRPDTQGRGLATGFDHSIRYVSRMTSNEGGINGNSWVVRTLPYLWFSNITVDGKPEEVSMVQGQATSWLWQTGAYRGQKGTLRVLTILGGGDYRVAGPRGEIWVFYGPDAVTALRGRLKSETGSDGIITQAAYNLDQRLESLTRTDPVSGESASLLYTYATSGANAGIILSVEKRLIRAGVELPLKRWIFTYFDGSTSGGSLNDLRSAEDQIWENHSGSWARGSRACYRYYKTDTSIGFKHGLRYVLDADGWSRMESLGLDPLNLSVVTDTVLAGYASAYYEYDSDHRLTKSILHAGTQEFTFARLNSDNASGRNWWRRTIETRPDGATVTTYVNSANDPVLKVLTKGGDSWPESWDYNTQFRETLHATSTAIASFTEPANASQNFTVTLHAAAGLIETKEYYPESGGGTGSAPGYLKQNFVKQGSSGTAVKQRELTYVTRTVGGDSIYKTADSKVYRDIASGGSNPATTSNAYTWRGSTFAVLQHTVTPPVVSTGENGTGATTTRVTVYDDYGNAQWRKNERGRIDYSVHDRLTGALLFRIEDADTSILDGVPSGWITQSGFGTSRRTDCQSDLLGRATLVLGPAHLVATKNDEGAVEAILTRRAEFACYLDEAREIRSARGGSTSGGLYTLGTATLRRLKYAGQELEVIEAARACNCGPLSPSEVFPQSGWKRWRREFFNVAAYRDESRVWYVIPATGEGFENVNYYATRYGRDTLGRQNRVLSPGGTINRQVIDARGLTLSVWIGTNDTGATNADPTGGGASGNNMVLVTTNVYDGGNDGGNGSLTSQVRPVDSNSANNRTESFEYDFRDRLIGESRSDGTNTYLVRYTLDNLGQTNQTDAYHTSVSSGNLTAQAKSYFDARRRNYKNETFTVDPSTGAVGNALIDQRWRDASGNVIKETFQGSEGFVKRTYDAFERVLRSYTGCNPSGGSNDNNPASDTVVEQSETLYDAAGNTVQSTAWQRFHDATGSGALNGPSGSQPKARRTYACRWQDALGREIAAAVYGTNGGAVLARPSVPPSTSEEVLVTITRHASTGEPGAVIDPMGTETRWKRDAIGRETETIENFKEGAAPAADVNRTTRFAYHASGGLEILTLVNEVTGDQNTRWVYGTTLTDSGVATGHLLRAKIYPESDDSNAPLGNGPDGVYERTEHTYNRQGEVVTTKDPNETVHAYDRDKLGRLLHDRITAFGTGIDPTVKRISITYEVKRLLTAKVTSYDHATPGSGSILNEVSYGYDGLGQMTKDRQSHNGAVVPGTTPEVGYTYETP